MPKDAETMSGPDTNAQIDSYEYNSTGALPGTVVSNVISGSFDREQLLKGQMEEIKEASNSKLKAMGLSVFFGAVIVLMAPLLFQKSVMDVISWQPGAIAIVLAVGLGLLAWKKWSEASDLRKIEKKQKKALDKVIDENIALRESVATEEAQKKEEMAKANTLAAKKANDRRNRSVLMKAEASENVMAASLASTAASVSDIIDQHPISSTGIQNAKQGMISLSSFKKGIDL